jgi:signal transduction histidine kinase
MSRDSSTIPEDVADGRPARGERPADDGSRGTGTGTASAGRRTSSAELDAVAAAKPPEWVSFVVCVAMIGGAAGLRLVMFGDRLLPIGFGVPLVLFGWLRSRRFLWVTAAGFIATTFFKFLDLLPKSTAHVILTPTEQVVDAIVITAEVLLVSAVVHTLIGAREWLIRRNAELATANRDLAAREEEIARANEELQSQAEELERQSEELRVTNDDLAARERTLATLLALSRALTTDLDRKQTLERICQTMGQLINGASTASAILVREGADMVVRCHHGFAGGLREERIPADRSFAGVVIGRGRTGYIEDVGLRPDLSIPRSKEGRPFVTVLACPLRVEGRPVGTLEVYGQDRGAWTDGHVALLESLAAQTSVSLEAAHLFESVQQERVRLEALLRAAPIGIAVANADCTDIRMNPAGAAMMGVPPDTNIAAPGVRDTWRAVIGGRTVTAQDLPLTVACREGREVYSVETDMYLPGNRRLIMLINAAPIRRDGRLIGAVGAFVDITPQKELQRELDIRRREAEEASVRKTRFLAAVSHDIRTPANAISLLAELIRRSAANPALAADVPGLALELHGSAMSLVNLLGDVLDVARFDSGKVELQETDFALDALFADEYRQLSPLARDKGLTLEYVPPDPPVWLRADRIKLSRVLGNLVGNAIKFTDRGSVRVTASAVTHEDGATGVEIRVSDTGIGIPPDAQRHIFDEFFQLRNPERDRNKGTGLGLTICNRLVDAMGGRLSVQSAVGEGSTFTITLPGSCITSPPPATPAATAEGGV